MTSSGETPRPVETDAQRLARAVAGMQDVRNVPELAEPLEPEVPQQDLQDAAIDTAPTEDRAETAEPVLATTPEDTSPATRIEISDGTEEEVMPEPAVIEELKAGINEQRSKLEDLESRINTAKDAAKTAIDANQLGKAAGHVHEAAVLSSTAKRMRKAIRYREKQLGFFGDLLNTANILDLKTEVDTQLRKEKQRRERLQDDEPMESYKEMVISHHLEKYLQTGAKEGQYRNIPELVINEIKRLLDKGYKELEATATYKSSSQPATQPPVPIHTPEITLPIPTPSEAAPPPASSPDDNAETTAAAVDPTSFEWPSVGADAPAVSPPVAEQATPVAEQEPTETEIIETLNLLSSPNTIYDLQQRLKRYLYNFGIASDSVEVPSIKRQIVEHYLDERVRQSIRDKLSQDLADNLLKAMELSPAEIQRMQQTDESLDLVHGVIPAENVPNPESEKFHELLGKELEVTRTNGERDKGWHYLGISYEGEDGITYVRVHRDEPDGRTYWKDVEYGDISIVPVESTVLPEESEFETWVPGVGDVVHGLDEDDDAEYGWRVESITEGDPLPYQLAKETETGTTFRHFSLEQLREIRRYFLQLPASPAVEAGTAANPLMDAIRTPAPTPKQSRTARAIRKINAGLKRVNDFG